MFINIKDLIITKIYEFIIIITYILNKIQFIYYTFFVTQYRKKRAFFQESELITVWVKTGYFLVSINKLKLENFKKIHFKKLCIFKKIKKKMVVLKREEKPYRYFYVIFSVNLYCFIIFIFITLTSNET